MNKTVLVTGATSFIGSRLVERLVLGTSYRIKAMVRRFSSPGLGRLARLPLELVSADLLDIDSLAEAAKNCDIIVHCAYGSSGNSEQRRRVTIAGTENVLKAALRANAKKVIHFSSAAVHGRNPKDPIVDESAPFEDSCDVYSASKIEAEKVVWRYHLEHSLPVVVFRPTLVYGPYSRVWTVRIVEEIKTGAVLVNGGNGSANLIYIDNLIDAILLALDKDSGDGEAFILVDDEQLTWQDVYRRYAEMMGTYPPFRNMSAEEIEAMRKTAQLRAFDQWVVMPWQTALEVVRYAFRPPEIRRKIRQIPWMQFVIRLVPRRVKDLVKGKNTNHERILVSTTKASHIQLPSREMVDLYSSRARFSNEKVKRILGYTQRITFEEAIELTGSWLRYQRLIQ